MSTLFTDNFTNTGGSDTDLASWQSVEQASGSNDWAYQSGTTSNSLLTNHSFQIMHMNLSFTTGGQNTYLVGRVINSSLTGVNDYKVIGQIICGSPWECSALGARLQSGAKSGYFIEVLGNGSVATCYLYKLVGGTRTDLDSYVNGSAYSSGFLYDAYIIVSGTTIKWLITGHFGDMTERTVTDSSFSSGVAGAAIHCWPDPISGAGPHSYMYVDNFSVETLITNTTLTASANVITLSAPTAALALDSTLVAGAAVITLSAPTASNVPTIQRKFPLERLEDVREVSGNHQVVPAVGRQQPSDIP
jgi:hypothetical protein